MKRKNLFLAIVALSIGVLFFSGCSTKKDYTMSFEQVISLLENQSKEMMDMFFDVDAQEKSLNLSTNVDTNGVNLDLDIQTQAKVDYESKVEDMDFSFDADVKAPDEDLDFTASWAMKYSLVWDNMYLKLSRFGLKWPSASDLAMVSMIVNSFKWQRFKFSMSGLSISKAFDLHTLYNDKLWEMTNKAGDAMINEWFGVYDWMFDEYKWYNAWKYSVDKEKFDEMLQIYVTMMDEFYSWLLNQYAKNLGADVEEMWVPNFSEMFSGVTFEELKWYFVIIWKNDVVETMENAHADIDGTWFIVNYYYEKDWLYFDAKTDDWEDVMLIVAKRNGRTYNVDVNMNSMMKIRWDIKFNQFSKKAWADIDFDLIVSIDSESLDDLEESKAVNVEIPFKWNYKMKSINSFSVQEPSDAVDLMEMVGGFLWSMDEEISDDYELEDTYEFEDTSLELE